MKPLRESTVVGLQNLQPVFRQEQRRPVQARGVGIQKPRIAFLGHSSSSSDQVCRARQKDAAKFMAMAPIQLAESIGASPPEILRGGY